MDYIFLLPLLPPVLAIVFTLWTKEVNISLFSGIFIGALLFTGFKPFETMTLISKIMSEKVGANFGVIFFLILLGMLICLMNKSGATHKYALWAEQRLKTKQQTLLATMLLGVLIFIDDYFNCVTVGTVMRPITDRKYISREKLAYIIDSTAAPVCIIAPVSSWAAAVSTSLPDGLNIDGFQLFLKTISCNFYSLLSLLMVLFVILLDVDYGKMASFEEQATHDGYLKRFNDTDIPVENGKGTVLDLLLPVSALITFCIIGMLYTGGFFMGVDIATAFAECDAMTGLFIGAFFTVFFIAFLYLPRKIVSFNEFMEALVDGFKNMVPTLLILIFAWTLSGICGSECLNTGRVVSSLVAKYSLTLNFMPPLFFAFAAFISMSTGTAWGTFAILLPIAVSVCGDAMTPIMIVTSAAVLGGSVCGDHLSPISDTTIMSSTGASCNHVDHVASQMQYGLVVAVISMVCYFINAFINNTLVTLLIGASSIVLLLLFIKRSIALQSKHNG